MQFTEFIDTSHFADGYSLLTPEKELRSFVDFIHISNFSDNYRHEVFTENCFSSFGINVLFPLNRDFRLIVKGKVYRISDPVCVPRNGLVITLQHPSTKVLGFRCTLNLLMSGNLKEELRHGHPVHLNQFIHKDLLTRIKETESLQDKIAEVQKMFMMILDDYKKANYTAKFVAEGIDCINEHFEDKLTIRQLSNELILSSRSLARYFTQYTLLPPKKVFKVMRFRRSIKDYLTCRHDFTFDKYGYHDISHFYNEIREFTGFYPNQILQQKDPDTTIPLIDQTLGKLTI
jgi:AraC-like DNA-binding protein